LLSFIECIWQLMTRVRVGATYASKYKVGFPYIGPCPSDDVKIVPTPWHFNVGYE